MGHKVHPTGFRLGVIRDWDAKWYADKHYLEYLQEDLKLREVVGSMYPEAGVSTVEIDRQANNVSMTIHTARPGILIGRGGQRVDELRAKLEDLVGKRVQLNIREIPQPELDAYLVARNVADQIERRLAYRRILNQTILRSMQAGAKGIKISCAGRLDGAEIARRVTMHRGQVPLHTLRADIDYGFAEARTAMGRIGVKVWLYRGDVLPAPKEVEEEVITEYVGPAMEETPEEAVEAAPEAEIAVQAEAEAVAEAGLPTEAEAEAVAEAEPPTEAEEKPATRRRTRKVAPAEAKAEEAAGVEEKPAAKKRTRKAAPAKTKPEVTAEGDVEAVAGVEEKPAEAKPATKRRTRKATPKAEAEAEETKETTAEDDDTTVEPPAPETAESQGDNDATT